MSVLLTPQPVSGPIPSGPKGDDGLYPAGDWTAGEYLADRLVRRFNCIFRSKVTTTQAPAFAIDGSVSSADWELFLDGRGIEEAGAYVSEASTARTEAIAARDDALATERRIRSQDLGDFANDAAAIAWAAAQSPAISIFVGSSYWNTTTHIKRICSATSPSITFVDEDADAQTQRTNAATSASAAATQAALATTKASDAATSAGQALTYSDLASNYANTANTQAGIATTKATEAAASAAAASSAGGYAAAALGAYNNANALLSSVSASAIIAQQAAASAVAVSNLSILAAAQRAVALMTGGSASFLYDTRRDSDGGAWVDKCVSQSWMTEALGTATRGVTAKFPKLALIVARNSASGNPAVTIYDMSDPTTPMWMVFIGNGYNPVPHGTSWPINSIAALNGRIFVGQGNSEGLAEIDLIADTLTQRSTACNLWLGGVVNRNANSATGYVATSSISPLSNGTVNSVAATIAPNTPLNPLRCNLPNPTVAVGTNGGLSIIRADGVVCNSASTTAFSSVAFDPTTARLWAIISASGSLAHIPQSDYMTAAWSINSTVFTSSQLGIGTLAKVTACGPGMVAVAGSTGLATIKLDPTNPANSLYRVKTSTYDTGWMVIGKTVLAMAESSTDLSAISDAELLVGGASPDTSSGWTAAAGGATLVAGAGTSGTAGWIAYQAITTVVGKRYRVKATLTNGTAAAFFCASSSLNAADLASIGGVAGARELTFVAETTTTFIQLAMNGSSAGQTCSFANLSTKATPNEVSGSGVSPAAVGSPTRAQVASGADTAAYGGFSSANYFRLSHVSALDQGTNDFAVMCPITFPATGSYSTICHYSDEAGSSYGSAAFWHFRVEYNGILAAVLFDGTTTQAVISTTTVPTSGVHNVAFARRGQWGELYLDGVRIARTSLSSLGSLSNASANLLVGVTYWNSSVMHPAVGKVGKLRLFSYAPTPDQFAFMMADEALGNVANTVTLLSGGNVQAVAFDPDTGQLAASNSTGGTDVFAGPGFSVRVANQKSTTGANLCPSPALASNPLAASLGSRLGAQFPTFGGEAWPVIDTTANTQHWWQSGTINFAAVAYTALVPVAAGAVVNALFKHHSSGAGATFVLSGAGSVSSTQGTGFTAASLIQITGGYLLAINFTPTSGFSALTVQPEAVAGTLVYAGAGNTALTIGKPMLLTGTYTATQGAGLFADALSANDNHKAVAFAGGDLVVATGAGVDAFLAVKAGLRETAGGVGAPRRPFYDPTWGQFYGLTTDATPTVFASIPIPEGKAFRFIARVAAAQYGGTATEKASYTVEGIVSRDIGGNVTVTTTTTAVSEVTSSMDCIAQANTTAQTFELKGTGKASTRLAWIAALELYDLGLMAAA